MISPETIGGGSTGGHHLEMGLERSRFKMKSPLHILHLEDDPNDVLLIHAALEGEGVVCEIKCVETREAFVGALERGGIDLILSDFSLPMFDGLSAIAIARARWPGIPVILVSGTVGEELAIDSMKSGATDYVLKGRLGRLGPAVRRAMQEVAERDELERAEKMILNECHFSEVSLNSLPGIFYLIDETGRFLRWNTNFERVSGYGPEEISRMKPTDFFTGDERDYIAKKIETVFAEGTVDAEAHFTVEKWHADAPLFHRSKDHNRRKGVPDRHGH
jgi:CheY-like chemotaxis protein